MSEQAAPTENDIARATAIQRVEAYYYEHPRKGHSEDSDDDHKKAHDQAKAYIEETALKMEKAREEASDTHKTDKIPAPAPHPAVKMDTLKPNERAAVIELATHLTATNHLSVERNESNIINSENGVHSALSYYQAQHEHDPSALKKPSATPVAGDKKPDNVKKP